MPRLLALLAFLCLAAPAAAQPRAPATVRVVLETAAGDIHLALEAERAPVTTANFLRYVDQHRLDGAAFYRAMRLAGGGGLVQGGPAPGRALPPIAHESTAQTGLVHSDGAISLARYAPGSATAEFFITVGAQPFLDAHPGAGGDDQGFAVFGHVVEGMDVVRRILAAPVSPTEGEGAMRGQMLSPRIRIVAARREP